MTVTDERDAIEVVIEQVRLRRLPPPEERRRLRKVADATLQDIADATGASIAAASLWERGINRPSRRYRSKYLALLDGFAALESEQVQK